MLCFSGGAIMSQAHWVALTEQLLLGFSSTLCFLLRVLAGGGQLAGAGFVAFQFRLSGSYLGLQGLMRGG